MPRPGSRARARWWSAGRAPEDPALRAPPEEAGDVREGVERPFGHDTADAGDRVQAFDDDTSPSVELARHLRDLVLRPRQRLHRRPLRDGGRIGGDLAL